MWKFKRNQTSKSANNTTPKEVKDYLRGEKQERMGKVWLLSVATFLGTIIVVLALVSAGRWAYRSVHNRHKTPATISVGQKPTTAKPTGGAAPAAPKTTTSPSATTPTTTPSSATTPATTSTTNSQLINTGPTSDE